MGMDAKGLLSEELKPRFCLKRVDGAIALGSGAPDRPVRNGAHDGLSRTAHEPIAPNFESAISWQKRNTVLKIFTGQN
jgi:hypothetical protein